MHVISLSPFSISHSSNLLQCPKQALKSACDFTIQLDRILRCFRRSPSGNFTFFHILQLFSGVFTFSYYKYPYICFRYIPFDTCSRNFVQGKIMLTYFNIFTYYGFTVLKPLHQQLEFNRANQFNDLFGHAVVIVALYLLIRQLWHIPSNSMTDHFTNLVNINLRLDHCLVTTELKMRLF